MSATTARRMAREFGFDAWANRRLIAAMEGAGGGSERARDLMSHVLGAQRVWLARLEGRPMPPDAFEPRPAAECAVIQQVLEAAWITLLGSMDDAAFARAMDYRNLKGDAFTNTVEDILTHVLYHGMYHRGQIAATLKADGVPVPGTDRITWARETQKS